MSAVPAWPQRAREEANLFNPAFLGQLVDRVATGHSERAQGGLPWALSFLALPVLLHKPTRDALPRDVRTSMGAWTQSHPLLIASLPERARSLRPLISEALLFSLTHGLVGHEGGKLLPGSRARRNPNDPWREPTEDFRACATRATFFGRWCATSGLPATVFALWEVRP
jgi:hypothetical protein